MPSFEDEAFVLRTRDLGEADRIVCLLTRDGGSVRAVARQARRSRRRFGAALEPLTRVRARWFEKNGRELHQLQDLQLLGSFAGMQADPLHQAVCAVWIELAESFSGEGQSEPRTFRLLHSVLRALERGGDPWVLLRYFEYWLLRVQGLLQPGLQCLTCANPIAPGRGRVGRKSGLSCPDCAPLSGEALRRFGPAEETFLARVASSKPEELSACDSCRGGGVLDLWLRGTIESFAERRFRAYRHLRNPLEGETA